MNDSRDVLTASENNQPGDDDYEAQAESGSINSSSYMSLKRNQQRLKKKKDANKTVKRKLDESLSNNAEQFSFYQLNPTASDEHQTTFHVEGGHKELSQSPEMGCSRNQYQSNLSTKAVFNQTLNLTSNRNLAVMPQILSAGILPTKTTTLKKSGSTGFLSST